VIFIHCGGQKRASRSGPDSAGDVTGIAEYDGLAGHENCNLKLPSSRCPLSHRNDLGSRRRDGETKACHEAI